ncbi:Uncharacterised protein [Vibrio cholerae]|nr:Uncharacterised protein [Vibrio cholerae]
MPLSARNGVKCAFKQLRAVRRSVERQSQHSAKPRLAEPYPKYAFADPFKLSRAVIHQENLHQQRSAGKQGDHRTAKPMHDGRAHH